MSGAAESILLKRFAVRFSLSNSPPISGGAQPRPEMSIAMPKNLSHRAFVEANPAFAALNACSALSRVSVLGNGSAGPDRQRLTGGGRPQQTVQGQVRTRPQHLLRLRPPQCAGQGPPEVPPRLRLGPHRGHARLPHRPARSATGPPSTTSRCWPPPRCWCGSRTCTARTPPRS